MHPIIEARKVEKSYGSEGEGRIQVIAPTDLAIYPGEILAVLGPSGSGKSTLLRILTGLAQPSAGEVIHHGRSVGGPCENVAIVFQSFALFPWLTVLENVAAPLKARGVPAEDRNARSVKILDTVGLDGFENAYPKELSGGMKQRVGFARALVVEPEVLFMDEPFSALDVLTAETLRGELLELWSSRKIPTNAIFIVTHNIDEAVELADRVIVLAHRPAHIHDDFLVGMPHPRDHKSPRFLELVDHVYKVLTLPDETHVLPAAHAAEQEKHAPLPHARPGGIAGLVEILGDRGGSDDLYHLAEELAMDLDDLLPIVEAATLLGFVEVVEGDARLSASGRAYAEASIDQRKQIFREAALERVALLRHIQSALRSKNDHALPAEFFRDILDERFSDEEAHRQFQTALDWGRYAEIFEYDSGSDRLTLQDTLTPAP